MAGSHLYFILNPAIGIIKIGIAKNVRERKKGLECAGGVPLELLAVVTDGARYEQHLHRAFTPTRLHGEWFNPSTELLALIDAPDTIPAFLERMAPQIASWDRERDERVARVREDRKAAHRAQKEKDERNKAIAAKRAATIQAKKDRQSEEQKAEWARLRTEWLERHPELADRVIKPAAVEAATVRRLTLAELQQRARNAALLGVRSVEPSE